MSTRPRHVPVTDGIVALAVGVAVLVEDAVSASDAQTSHRALLPHSLIGAAFTQQ
jgi:hypothetical protein